MITPERLQEIVTVGVHDITPTEILEIAEELQTLHRDYTVCTLENAKGSIRLDELKEQNKALIEDAVRMGRLVEIIEEEFDVDYSDMEEADASACRTFAAQHHALMQEING